MLLCYPYELIICKPHHFIYIVKTPKVLKPIRNLTGINHSQECIPCFYVLKSIDKILCVGKANMTALLEYLTANWNSKSTQNEHCWSCMERKWGMHCTPQWIESYTLTRSNVNSLTAKVYPGKQYNEFGIKIDTLIWYQIKHVRTY